MKCNEIYELKKAIKNLDEEEIGLNHCVRLKSHFHTKNYLEMEHTDQYSTGIKLKYNDNTYVITCAHNIEKVKLPPFQHGLKHLCDLPVTQLDKSSSKISWFGDGDTFQVNERSILVTSTALGAAFYDITYATSEGTVLLDFIPKQDKSDVQKEMYPDFNSEALEQAWCQCKCNKRNKYVYQMMGEQRAPHMNRTNITIYDCSRADHNEIKIVNKFNEKWNLNDPEHLIILEGIWEEVIKGSGEYDNIQVWMQSLVNEFVIGDCHNLQIDSENDLLFLIDVENTNIGLGRKVYLPTLVYDISDSVNNFTGRPCSETPKLLRILERNITLKQLTDAEISRIIEGTEEYDSNQNMILDMPINATFRPHIQLSSIGSLKRSDIGLPDTTVFNPVYMCQYNHDLSIFKKDNKTYAVTCYQERSHYLRDNNVYASYSKIRHFGNTMGNYAIFDITNIRSTDTLTVYQTPIHAGMKDSIIRGPMDAFAHNAVVKDNILFTATEISSNKGVAADKDYQVQSLISIYDISNLSNIKFKKYLSNFSWIKSVSPFNVNKFGGDWNHNFALTTFKGRDYLAMADFIDGVSVFDITDETYKLVGKCNSTRFIQAKNPYYASDRQGVLFPWCKIGSSSGVIGAWGVNFGAKDDLYVMTKESVSVYSIWDLGQDDIRDYQNMKTKERFTKYPSLQRADSIIAYDNQKNIELQIVTINTDLDIAILQGNGILGGYEKLSLLQNHNYVSCFNHSHDTIFSKISSVVSNRCNLPPVLIYKKYDSGKEGLLGLNDQYNTPAWEFQFNHASIAQDLGMKNETSLNYAPKVIQTLPSFMLSRDIGSGSSGSAVVKEDKLCGMITLNEKYGNISKSIGIYITPNLIETVLTNQIPYLGLELDQNIFEYEGYIVMKIDKNSSLYTTLKDEEPPESIVTWELLSINNIEVGIDKTKIGFIYSFIKVNDRIRLKFRSWVNNQKLKEISIFFNVIQRPNYATIDETSTKSGNFFPDVPWFYQELFGAFI